MSTAVLSPLEFDLNPSSANGSTSRTEATHSKGAESQESHVGHSPTLDKTLRKFRRCCWLIGMTSAFDAFLAVYFKETILYLEQNPVCLQLIEWEPTFMSLFIVGKFTGTLMAIGVMVWLFRFRRHMGFAVAMAISVFQVGLIAYQMIS